MVVCSCILLTWFHNFTIIIILVWLYKENIGCLRPLLDYLGFDWRRSALFLFFASWLINLFGCWIKGRLRCWFSVQYSVKILVYRISIFKKLRIWVIELDLAYRFSFSLMASHPNDSLCGQIGIHPIDWGVESICLTPIIIELVLRRTLLFEL